MSSQPEWLIRSGSRVLGPYTQGEVLLKLREKELSLHDEISEPLGRWWPIQYHPRLEDIVEDFRSQTTTDLTDAMGTRTPTVSLTDALNEINGNRSGKSSSTKAEPKVVETFGVYKHSEQNKNLKGTQNLAWMVSIAVVIVGTGFFWFQQKNKTQKIEKSEQVNYLKDAERALFVGNYPQALDAYKKLAEKNPQNNEYSIYLAPLYLQVGNQALLAKRELEKIPQLDQSPEAQTAMGLIYFIEKNKSKSQEHWQKAMALNTGYDPALLNMAYLKMDNKAWSQARQWLESYYRRDQSASDWNIAYAISSIELFDKIKNPRVLREADLMLSDTHLKIQDRIQDVLLIRARIADLANDNELHKKLIVDLLNQDIEGFKKVRQNAFVANSWFESHFMSPLCRAHIGALSSQPEKGLMETYCFIRSGQMDLALKRINQLREQMPKHALVQAWASYILDQRGQQDEASVMLGRAIEMNRSYQFLQPLILQAQFCFSRKDYSCAEQNWQIVLQQRPDSLVAGTALAQIKILSGRENEGNDDVKRLQQVSEDYKPLLEMLWAQR